MNGSVSFSYNLSTWQEKPTLSIAFGQPNFYHWFSFTCGLLLIPITIFGVFGNAITIVIFSRRKSTISSSINVLLVGLAFFDIWLLLTATPLFSALAISAAYRTRTISAVIGFLTFYAYPLCSMAQSASAWTLIIISLERYLAVCRPFVARTMNTVRRALYSLTFIFVFSIFYNFCRFYEYTLEDEKPVYRNLIPFLRANRWYTKIYINWMYLIVMFVVPFGFLSVLNSLVIRGVRKARLNRRKLSYGGHRGRRLSNEYKTTLMMIVVMLLFLLCNFLALILNAVETLHDELITTYADLFFLLTDLNNLLVEINSSVNCVVYYCFSQKFRPAIRRLLCLELDVTQSKENSFSAFRIVYGCSLAGERENSLVLLKSLERKDTLAINLI